MELPPKPPRLEIDGDGAACGRLGAGAGAREGEGADREKLGALRCANRLCAGTAKGRASAITIAATAARRLIFLSATNIFQLLPPAVSGASSNSPPASPPACRTPIRIVRHENLSTVYTLALINLLKIRL
jgi:hypothetical protein